MPSDRWRVISSVGQEPRTPHTVCIRQAHTRSSKRKTEPSPSHPPTIRRHGPISSTRRSAYGTRKVRKRSDIPTCKKRSSATKPSLPLRSSTFLKESETPKIPKSESYRTHSTALLKSDIHTTSTITSSPTTFPFPFPKRMSLADFWRFSAIIPDTP